VVFGVGSAQAELMLVGEGPGFNEDRQGEPFVGQAGKLLTELPRGHRAVTSRRLHRKRGQVPAAGEPRSRPDEIAACSPHLMEQIAIIRPRVICTLGRFATKLLADTSSV